MHKMMTKTNTAVWYIGKLKIKISLFLSQGDFKIIFLLYLYEKNELVLTTYCGNHFTIYTTKQTIMLKALIYTEMHVNYFSIKLEKQSINMFFFSQKDSTPIIIVLGNILYLTSSQPET